MRHYECMCFYCLCFIDSATHDTLRPRWMTVIGDNVLQNLQGKRSGYQLVMGMDFEVKDFMESLVSKEFTIKSKRVTLMIGSNMIRLGDNINLGNRLEKLIRYILTLYEDTQFWVCSVLPRPGAVKEMDHVIRKVNVTVSHMCKKLNKEANMSVIYVPVHCEFMEQWKHFDQRSQKMQVTTEILKQYFSDEDTIALKPEGINKVFEIVERYVSGGKPAVMKKRQHMVNLKVEFENVREEDPEVTVKMDNTRSTSPVSCKGNQGNVVGKVVTASTDRPSVAKNKVAEMIQRWENRDRTDKQVTDLDRELGEDSIVQVDLGDQYMEEEDEDGDSAAGD